jgi:hypothetical protein
MNTGGKTYLQLFGISRTNKKKRLKCKNNAKLSSAKLMLINVHMMFAFIRFQANNAMPAVPPTKKNTRQLSNSKTQLTSTGVIVILNTATKSFVVMINYRR